MGTFLVRGLQRVSDDWSFEMQISNRQRLMRLQLTPTLPTVPAPS